MFLVLPLLLLSVLFAAGSIAVSLFAFCSPSSFRCRCLAPLLQYLHAASCIVVAAVVRSSTRGRSRCRRRSPRRSNSRSGLGNIWLGGTFLPFGRQIGTGSRRGRGRGRSRRSRSPRIDRRGRRDDCPCRRRCCCRPSRCRRSMARSIGSIGIGSIDIGTPRRLRLRLRPRLLRLRLLRRRRGEGLAPPPGGTSTRTRTRRHCCWAASATSRRCRGRWSVVGTKVPDDDHDAAAVCAIA